MRFAFCALATITLFLVGQAVQAAEPTTVITVQKMHCAGCAKAMVAKVGAVAGVAKVETDVKAKTVTITPKGAQTVSPKALWEAVEQADDNPLKLAGPSGVFTKKPQV